MDDRDLELSEVLAEVRELAGGAEPVPPHAVTGVRDVLAFADDRGLADADADDVADWMATAPMPLGGALGERMAALSEMAVCAEIAERAERLAHDYRELARRARQGERVARATYREIARESEHGNG